MSNKGIINNGTFNVGQMAIGSHASVNSYGAQDQRELMQRLDALRGEIRASRLPPERREKLTDVVDGLKDEAASPSPDKSKFERGLEFVEGAASSVSAIATAVKVVKGAVALLL